MLTPLENCTSGAMSACITTYENCVLGTSEGDESCICYGSYGQCLSDVGCNIGHFGDACEAAGCTLQQCGKRKLFIVHEINHQWITIIVKTIVLFIIYVLGQCFSSWISYCHNDFDSCIPGGAICTCYNNYSQCLNYGKCDIGEFQSDCEAAGCTIEQCSGDKYYNYLFINRKWKLFIK